MIYIELFGIIILAFFIYYFGLLPLSKGVPFAVSTPAKVKKIITLAGDLKGKKIADLGSGDGRIVIALAQAGAEAHGYEINLPIVWLSRWRIKKSGVNGQAFIHRKNYWSVNLAEYDVIVLFGVWYIMEKLEKKLSAELKPGTMIISNFCSLPHWQILKQDDKIFVYRKP